MNGLDERIAEAQAADAELARLENLRADLPGLQVKRARQQQGDRARERLQAVEARSHQVLTRFRPGVTTWRERFAVLVKDAEALAVELANVQGPVSQVAQDVVGAVNEANRAGVPTDHAAAVWLRLGWGDEDLEALPDNADGRVFRIPDFDEKVGALLAERAGVKVLAPASGIRQYARGV